MNELINQLGVSPEIALETAERILNAKLVCSLDGKYQTFTTPAGRQVWRSDAWPSFSTPAVPGDYRAPLLQWFRGLDLEISKGQTQFAVHGLLDIERQIDSTDLPAFNLFEGFSSLFGDSEKAKPDEKAEKSEDKK